MSGLYQYTDEHECYSVNEFFSLRLHQKGKNRTQKRFTNRAIPAYFDEQKLSIGQLPARSWDDYSVIPGIRTPLSWATLIARS